VQHEDLRKEGLLPFLIAELRKEKMKEPEPISMADVKVFTYTYWILLGVCSMVFGVEWAFIFWFKRMKVRVLRDELRRLNPKERLASTVKGAAYSLYRFYPNPKKCIVTGQKIVRSQCNVCS